MNQQLLVTAVVAATLIIAALLVVASVAPMVAHIHQALASAGLIR